VNYRIQYSENNLDFITPNGGNSFADMTFRIQNLTPNTQYYVRIASVSNNQPGGYYVRLVATTVSPPTNLNVLKIGDNSISFSWDAVEEADAYSIYVNDLFDHDVVASQLNTTVSGLTEDTTYSITVISSKNLNQDTVGITETWTTTNTKLIEIVAGTLGGILVVVIIVGLVMVWKISQRKKRFTDRDTLATPLISKESDTLFNDHTGLTTEVTSALALPAFLEIHENDARLFQLFAKGGASQIWIGDIVNPDLKKKSPAHGEKVAVKKIIAKPESNPHEMQQRFFQEVAVLSFFNYHENCVGIVGYIPSTLSIVMPYYEHGNLMKFLDSSADLTSLDVIDLTYQLVSILNDMHTAGIAHRDLKTLNILIDKRDLRPSRKPGCWSSFPFQLKLTDFGNCFVSSSQVAGFSFLNPEGISAAYCAPEIFARLNLSHSQATLDFFKNTDVYSFGICLWEMLHRATPWARLTSQEIREKVQQGERPTFSVEVGEDSKLIFLKSAVINSLSQIPRDRPNFSQLLTLITSLMKESEVAIIQTKLIKISA